jgi:uncharacterized membrane protein YphA (DoxX/SURF4 family)
MNPNDTIIKEVIISASPNPTSSRFRVIAYWMTTALVAFALGAGGVADVLLIQPVLEGMTKLGYPSYFCVILGIWKVLGAAAILIPRFPRLKEWAYAGAVFDFTGAAASHWAVNDDAMKLVAPLVLTVLAIASWTLRPSTRRLDN